MTQFFSFTGVLETQAHSRLRNCFSGATVGSKDKSDSGIIQFSSKLIIPEVYPVKPGHKHLSGTCVEYRFLLTACGNDGVLHYSMSVDNETLRIMLTTHGKVGEYKRISRK